MANKDQIYVTMENATIGYKNFRGLEGAYNRAGAMNFCVFFDDRQQAQELYEQGFNVKKLDDPERDPYLQIKVAFGNYPPKILLIQEYPNGKTKAVKITEETVGMLDNTSMSNVDLTFRSYNYAVRGTEGKSAYLTEMYVTTPMSNLSTKYAKYEEMDFDEEDCPF